MLSAIQREVDCWTLLQGSPFVNPLIGAWQDDAAVYLLQPLCRGGDVELLLMDEGCLSEQQAADLMAPVLGFLTHCHSLGVAFRDIKPANFLLVDPHPPPRATFRPMPSPLPPPHHKPAPPCDLTLGGVLGLAAAGPSGPELRVVDFGCCRKGADVEGGGNRLEGTLLYMAPEVLEEGAAAAGPAADVWAAGVMLFEMLTGRFPFWEEDIDSLGHLPPSAIRCGILGAQVVWQGPGSSSVVSPEARQLISSFLQRDPSRRPSPERALRHPWLLKHTLHPTPPPAHPAAPPQRTQAPGDHATGAIQAQLAGSTRAPSCASP